MAGWIAAKLLATIGTLIPTILQLMSSGSVASSSSTATDPVQALERLKRLLLRIQAVLHDAEEREIRDESVKLWLKEIKEVAYDAEDVLDEYEYELLRYQVEGRAAPESEASSSSSSSSRKRKLEEMEEQVCGPTSTSCSLDSPMIGRELVDSVNKINERFDEIAKDRDALHLREEDGSRRKDDCMIPQPTGPYVDESGIYGREIDTAKIVDLLLSGEEKFTVLPIVGMGGLGKTTLAQLVYNNESINQFFNLKGWVCVSVDFDVIRLNRAIIESFTGQRCDLTELSALQNIVKEKIENKRVLLVLDDIWNEEQSPWDLLKAPLLHAEKIKILMTTRNDSVARIMQTMPSHHLDFLSEEKSWLLFERHAFADRDSMEHPILMDIGRRIVKKCGGLPLALKVIGGLLRYKEANEDSWEDILQSNLWELDETQNQVLPALRLSYLYMPTYLKPCFLYCSLFPKTFTFRIKEVIRLWVAQGYIIQSKNKKSVKDIGREYVELLHRRSLLHIQAGYRKPLFFHMHDLVYDLASSLSGKEFHQILAESDVEDIPNEVRHLYIDLRQEIDWRHLFSRLPKALRTLLIECYQPGLIVNELFPLVDLRCLRALDLNLRGILEGLWYSIGNLKRLRYLKSRETERLPESIGQLYNLQVLDLYLDVRELPSGTGNLASLRVVRGVNRGTCMPRGIGKLTNLETLNGYFNVKRGAWHCGIEELKGLVNLRGRLCISGLSNVARVEDAREANLRSKQRIERLDLEWKNWGCEREHGEDEVEEEAGGNGEEESRDAELEAAVLDSLCPCTNLRQLFIQGYDGARFPSWMGDPSFSRLVHVSLSCIQNCEHLPALGQLPSLESLRMEGMRRLRKMGREFCCSLMCENTTTTEASFPSLMKLYFCDMPEWEEWCGVVHGDFPRLSDLTIQNCPKMRSLTLQSLSSLHDVGIVSCDLLESVSGLQSLSSLRNLNLCYCPQLRLSTDEPLPPTLQDLTVSSCGGLSILPLHHTPTALEYLTIKECPQLSSLAGGLQALASLKRLILESCPKLQIPPSERLSSIPGWVTIEDCPGLIEWCQAHGFTHLQARTSWPFLGLGFRPLPR